MKNESVPKLLRAIAASTEARRLGHDVIFNAAADELDRLRNEVAHYQHAASRGRLPTEPPKL